MKGEFSTTPDNSQEGSSLSERPLSKITPSAAPKGGPNFHLIWLIFTALIWGGPIITAIYFPLAAFEQLLPKKSSFRNSLRQFRKKLYARCIFIYLKMQSWFNPEIDLDELRKLEKTNTPFLMVANHRSHLDVFLMISQIEGLQLLAKKALFYVPILGMMMRVTKQIPAEKGDWNSLESAVETVHKRIRLGERVLIFPEFTRCAAGFRGLNSFSLLPFQIAMKEKVKILILVVSGTDEVWPKGSVHLKASDKKQKIVALAPIDTNNFQSVQELRDCVYTLTKNKLLEEYQT